MRLLIIIIIMKYNILNENYRFQAFTINIYINILNKLLHCNSRIMPEKIKLSACEEQQKKWVIYLKYNIVIS